MVVQVIPQEPVNPTTADKVITSIQLAYGVPSLILLFFFLFFLGCSKQYSNSFYRLVQMDHLINILVYTNTWPGNRLGKIPAGVVILRAIEGLIPGYLTISHTLFNVFQHMQFCSSAALNLHRISSVVFFKRYEKFWSRYYPVYFLVSVIYSFFPLLWIRVQAAHVSIINDTLKITYYWDAMSQYIFLSAVFSVIYAVLILVVGLSTAFLVSRTVKNFNQNDHGVSKKLTKIALTSCVLYTGVIVWTIINSIDSYFPFLPKEMLVYRMDILMFSSDMITLTLPYILLMFDSNIRKDIKKAFSRDVSSGTNQIFVSTSSAAQQT